MHANKMTWPDFAARYCKTQDETPEGLADRLATQAVVYEPDGFFIAEAQLFDSSWFGQVVILPFGPRNTFKTVPDHPFSTRGLASDTSVAIGWIAVKDVPQTRTAQTKTETVKSLLSWMLERGEGLADACGAATDNACATADADGNQEQYYDVAFASIPDAAKTYCTPEEIEFLDTETMRLFGHVMM